MSVLIFFFQSKDFEIIIFLIKSLLFEILLHLDIRQSEIVWTMYSQKKFN